LVPLATRLEQILGVSSADAPPEETFLAVRRVLETLARDRPVVVAFDDVHWAEPTFLDLVEHVADLSRDAAILLLIQARPELLDVRPGWGGGKLNATTILLEPLGEGETALLVRNLLGGAELAPDVRARITQASGGTPLFLEELLSKLIDEGALVRRDGRWEPAGDLRELEVPATIQALIAARLDLLAPAERAVLERASVIGQVFYGSAVRELCPSELAPAVPGELRSLIRKELVRPERGELGEEDAYRFRHLLVRDAVYGAMPKELRAELHERFGGWLEGHAGALEVDEFVGYHLEQARRFLAELGPEDETQRSLGERAATLLLASGERAFGRGDVSAASRLLRRVLLLVPEDHPIAVRAAPLLARALHEAGDLAGAIAVAEESIRVARAVGDRGAGATATVVHAMSLVTGQRGSELRGALDRIAGVIPDLERLGDDTGLAAAWSATCILRFWSGDATGGLEAGARSLDHARRSGRPGALHHAMSAHVGPLLWGPIPVGEAIARARALRAEAVERGLLSHFLDETIAALAAMRGEFETAESLLAAAGEAIRELGLRLHAAAGHFTATVELLAGRFEDAERMLTAGIEELRSMGERGFASTSAAYLAEAQLLQGRAEDALTSIALARELAEPDDVIAMVDWRRLRASALATLGRDLDEAERLAREALASAESTDYVVTIGQCHQNLAEVLRSRRSQDEAREHLREAVRLYEAKENLVMAGRAEQLLATG